MIYLVAFLLVLGALGVPLSSIGAAVGLIGLGVSFALREIISNFISGMMILINKPFKIRDQIEVNGQEGTVKDIHMVASDVKTFDGHKMIVPNSTLYKNIVHNSTAYDQRRFEIIVSISFDSDIEKARKLAEESLKNSEKVLESPEPKVMVEKVGESSVDLRLWGWSRPQQMDHLEAASEAIELVKESFDEEGIEIPYPVRKIVGGEELDLSQR